MYMYLSIYLRSGFWGVRIGISGTTKIVTKRPNMDRTGPRIYDHGAVHLNIDFETPGYIKIYQIVLYILGGLGAAL